MKKMTKFLILSLFFFMVPFNVFSFSGSELEEILDTSSSESCKDSFTVIKDNTEYKASSLNFEDNNLNQPDSCFTQQEDLDFLNYKIKCLEYFGKEFFKRDKKRYIEILKVVFAMFDPVMFKSKAKGGQKRVNEGAVILNKLLTIHRNYAYCSDKKRVELLNLLNEAKLKLKRLDSMELQPNDKYVCLNASSLNPEIKKMAEEIKVGVKNIRSVGGNLNIGIFTCGGVGFAVGKSITPYGSRYFTLTGNSTLSFGTPALMGGYYSFKCKNHGRVHSNKVENLNNSYLFVVNEKSKNKPNPMNNTNISNCDNEKPYILMDFENVENEMMRIQEKELYKEHNIFEVGVGITVFDKFFYFKNMELFKISPDYSYLFKKLKIEPSTGILPRKLIEKINSCKSKKDLKILKKTNLNFLH